MQLRTAPYLEQKQRWPLSGRHILAQFDEESVVVYQAYRPAIGHFADQHGYFGGDFSLGRMSWIKPNFLWMMFRSGWGTKEGQEVTLDPDHNPTGHKVERRAIQLGLRGDVLARYAREWVVRIEDVSAFVAEQRPHAQPDAFDRLILPREEVYPVTDPAVARRLGIGALQSPGD
jgi:hypothetical protein